jgi:Holliday junction resolvase RusA-like endonuclease
MIEFFVPGDPAAQGRPRARVLRMGGRVAPQIYNPHNADEWKDIISIIARPHCPRVPLLGPVRLTATFLIGRPQKHSTKKGLRPNAPMWHTSKPDADNFVKALKDALTGVRMWGDDSQVCDERVLKIYDETPGCFVAIEPIKTPPKLLIDLWLPSQVRETTPTRSES